MIKPRLPRGMRAMLAGAIVLIGCASEPLGNGTGAAGTSGGGGTTGAAGAGGGCTFNGATHAEGSTFPAGDDCNICSCTSGGQVACTTRACPPDGGGAPCQLDAVYAYGNTGGFVAYEDQVKLTPPNFYEHTRTPVRTTSGSNTAASCTPALPACDTAGALDIADVMRDLEDADVQAALAASTPPTYGNDQRPVDGSIFSLERADGRGFLMGAACSAGGSSCVAIPPGVAKLAADLMALDQQQLADPSCSTLR